MLKDLIKESWLNKQDILDQIRDDYDRWYTLAKPLRELYKEETRLFNYQKKNKDKIGDSTLFNVHSALMAREYIDKPTSKFQAHSNNQNRIVNNLNLALKADMNSSYMENLIYDWKHDKFLRWHWTIIRNGWDGDEKMPFFETVDPRLEILDPDGDYRNGDYWFYGFEKDDYIKTMKAWEGYENIWDDINKATSESEAKTIKREDQDAFKMQWTFSESKTNPAVALYYHFAIFGDVRAMVITANERNLIVKVKILKPVKRIKAFDDVIAITYHKPRRNNPYGDRVARYVGDVQIMKSILANLRLEKIKSELYPMYLRNTRLISNKGDLDIGFNKVIDASPIVGESLNNALVPITKDLRADNSYILDDSLDRQVEASTSLGKIAQGSAPERREWVGTNQLIQGNTDINLSLGAKVDAIWYEKLLQVWLCWYLEEFKSWDNKVVYIQTSTWSISRQLKKAEFLKDTAIKITVDTVIEINERLEKDRVAYWQAIWLLQSIERPESAKNATMRKYLASLNLSSEDIDEQVPQTAQEIIADINVGLLLEGHFIKIQSTYDPDTHLIAIKSAWDGDNVEIYKKWLLDLKTIQKQAPAPQEDPAMKNNLLSQAMGQVGNEAIQAGV